MNRARSAYSSACQSWLSICVVSGFQVRPRPSTNERLTCSQSALGHRGQMRAVRAGRAVELAQVLPCRSTRASWRSQPVGRARPAPCPASSASPAGRACARASARRARSRAMAASCVDERRGPRAARPRSTAPRDHERVGEVVDVLAGAARSGPARAGRRRPGRGELGEPPLEEVLDRLDVVDGHPLELGELGDLGRPEVLRRSGAARPARAR